MYPAVELFSKHWNAFWRAPVVYGRHSKQEIEIILVDQKSIKTKKYSTRQNQKQ